MFFKLHTKDLGNLKPLWKFQRIWNKQVLISAHVYGNSCLHTRIKLKLLAWFFQKLFKEIFWNYQKVAKYWPPFLSFCLFQYIRDNCTNSFALISRIAKCKTFGHNTKTSRTKFMGFNFFPVLIQIEVHFEWNIKIFQHFPYNFHDFDQGFFLHLRSSIVKGIYFCAY